MSVGENGKVSPRFQLEKRLKNVTVEILRDIFTGEYSIGWYKQDNTEDITEEGVDDGI